MAEYFHDFVTPNSWPRNLPDLNPFDYYVWCVVENEVKNHPQGTKLFVMEAIPRAIDDINKDHLNKLAVVFEHVLRINPRLIYIFICFVTRTCKLQRLTVSFSDFTKSVKVVLRYIRTLYISFQLLISASFPTDELSCC